MQLRSICLFNSNVCALQVYDYLRKTARVIFGPDLVSEQLHVLWKHLGFCLCQLCMFKSRLKYVHSYFLKLSETLKYEARLHYFIVYIIFGLEMRATKNTQNLLRKEHIEYGILGLKEYSFLIVLRKLINLVIVYLVIFKVVLGPHENFNVLSLSGE